MGKLVGAEFPSLRRRMDSSVLPVRDTFTRKLAHGAQRRGNP